MMLGRPASVNTSTAEPDDMQPLDLSKKSHLAGYKLADKPSYSQSEDNASEKVDTASSTEEESEVKQEKPQTTEARYICMACYGRYDQYDDMLDHQEADHPNVKCGYTQLEEEVARNWKITPNPIGVLNVCSTQLPPVTGKYVLHGVTP
jgi:repressor of nif and glnA expression